jgi:hypothetical protein
LIVLPGFDVGLLRELAQKDVHLRLRARPNPKRYPWHRVSKPLRSPYKPGLSGVEHVLARNSSLVCLPERLDLLGFLWDISGLRGALEKAANPCYTECGILNLAPCKILIMQIQADMLFGG